MCANVSQLIQLMLLFIACYDPISIERTWIQLDGITWGVRASERASGCIEDGLRVFVHVPRMKHNKNQ